MNSAIFFLKKGIFFAGDVCLHVIFFNKGRFIICNDFLLLFSSVTQFTISSIDAQAQNHVSVRVTSASTSY